MRWLGEERKIVDCKSDDIPFAPDPEYLEGPWMEKIGAKYYLFYAELFRDPRAPGYWTGVAYADSPLGPWKKDPRGQVFRRSISPFSTARTGASGFRTVSKTATRAAVGSPSIRLA